METVSKGEAGFASFQTGIEAKEAEFLLTEFLCNHAKQFAYAGMPEEDMAIEIHRLNLQMSGELNIPVAKETEKLVLKLVTERQGDIARGSTRGLMNLSEDPWGEPLTQVDAYRPREPLAYAVNRILYRGTVSVWFAPSGVMKSMLLLDQAYSILLERFWLVGETGSGILGFETKPGAIIWYNGDNPTDVLIERMNAIGRFFGVSDKAAFYVYSFPEPPLNVAATEDANMFIERIRRYGATVAVFDNLQLIKGDADENKSSEMQPVMSGLRRIAEKSNCAVVVIHHVNKGNGYRGSTTIENLADSTFSIERKALANEIIIRPMKVRRAPVSPFAAKFVFEHRNGTDELEAAHFVGVPFSGGASDNAMAELVFRIIKSTGEMKKGALIDKMRQEIPKASKEKCTKIVEALLEQEMLLGTPGLKNSQIISLPVC